MTASLTSAFVLLALLLIGGHHADATPSSNAGATNTATSVLPGYQAPGYASIDVQPGASIGRATFSPQPAGGSAPGVSASSFETISSLDRTIAFDHAKPGKLAAAGAGWSSAGTSSVYIGAPAGLALEGGAPGESATRRYSPGATANVRRDGRPAVLNATYIPDPPRFSTRSLASSSKLSATVQPSGSFYAAAHALDLANIGSTAHPSIEGFAIDGIASGPHNAGSDITGEVVPTGGTMLMPMTVIGTGPGDLTFNLTIFTNAGSAASRAGEIFNFLLDPMVVSGRAGTAPATEPGSIALVGVGFAAIAALCRRRLQLPRTARP